MQITTQWTACVLVLLTQTLLMSALGESGASEKLSVIIGIDCLEADNIVMRIDNPTNKEQRIKTNLEQISSSSFLGCPTRAALQFRDATGKRISFKGQTADGWGYPSRYSSLAEENGIGKVSEIIVPKKQARTFSIQCSGVFDLATSERLGDKSNFIKDFRIRIPLKISGASGKMLSIYVISGWLPFSNTLNASPES